MIKRSDYLLLGAVLLSLIASVILWFTGNKDSGLFVGLWVPSLLGFGIYLKILYREVHHE